MDRQRSRTPFGKPSYGSLEKVSDHCYIFRNTVNSGVIVTDEGVAVVDTQINASMARRLIRAIREVTAAPIRYAINTHYHWDHWAGNDVFVAEGAQLVCSSRTREFMGRRHLRQRAFLTGRGFHMPAEDPAKPDIALDGRLDLHLGGLTLRLEYLGDAETTDATAITVEEDRVVIAGDTLMTGSFPILGQPVSTEGLDEDGSWIRTLRRIKDKDPVAVIPGHGPLGGVAEVEFFAELMEYFLQVTEDCVIEGLDQEATLAKIMADLPQEYRDMAQTWGTPEYAILRALKSYTGWQHVKPSAIPTADPADLEAARADLETAASSYLDAARQARESGKTGLAIDLLREGQRAFPDDPSVLTAYADLLIDSSKAETSVLEKGDFFIEARRSLVKALEIEPDHGPALVSLGGYLTLSAYQSGDDPGEGMALLERARDLDLDEGLRARVEFFQGVGHRVLEDEDEALASFRRSLEIDPTNPLPRMALGEFPPGARKPDSAGLRPGTATGRPPTAQTP